MAKQKTHLDLVLATLKALTGPDLKIGLSGREFVCKPEDDKSEPNVDESLTGLALLGADISSYQLALAGACGKLAEVCLDVAEVCLGVANAARQ